MCVHVRVQGVPGVPQTENLALWYDSEGYVMGESFSPTLARVPHGGSMQQCRLL